MKTISRNTNLDIMRIIAAFMVVIVHVGDQFPNVRQVTYVGKYGVECFFVLSGYLILKSLENSKSNKEFYIKRFIKIAPGYYFTLVIIYIVDAVRYLLIEGMPCNSVFLNGGPCSIKFFRHLFFLQMIIPSDHYLWWNNRYALWTMSSFVFFYIIAPFVFKGINRLKNKFNFTFFMLLVLLAIRPICISFLMQFPVIVGDLGDFPVKTPINTLYCFWFGVTLYYAIKENKQNLYCCICGLLMILSQFKLYPYPIIFLLLINICIHSSEFIKNDRIKKALSFLSQGSFYLYLCHPILLAIFNLICNRIGINGILKAAILCIGIMSISYAVYYILIIPLDKKLKEWSVKKI